MNLNNDNLLKTLGTLAAKLVVTLYQNKRPIFHFKEAAEILNGRAPANKVLSQLIKHGIVMRLKPGSFRLVPFELGFEREYLGNPYIVAKELVLRANKGADNAYYLSHGSAFDLHQMVTQPQFVVYISSPKMIRSLSIQGTEFKFVRCKPQHLFGLTYMWQDKTEKVCVSDLERTLLDGLKQPAYCGGFSEVAKAFCIKHQSIDPQKLIDYAIKLKVGVVLKRLGYLMELYQIGEPSQWEFLRSKITSTYLLLDPELPAEGHHIAKWRLKLNIPEAELLAIGGT